MQKEPTFYVFRYMRGAQNIWARDRIESTARPTTKTICKMRSRGVVLRLRIVCVCIWEKEEKIKYCELRAREKMRCECEARMRF